MFHPSAADWHEVKAGANSSAPARTCRVAGRTALSYVRHNGEHPDPGRHRVGQCPDGGRRAEAGAGHGRPHRRRHRQGGEQGRPRGARRAAGGLRDARLGRHPDQHPAAGRDAGARAARSVGTPLRRHRARRHDLPGHLSAAAARRSTRCSSCAARRGSASGSRSTPRPSRCPTRKRWAGSRAGRRWSDPTVLDPDQGLSTRPMACSRHATRYRDHA